MFQINNRAFAMEIVQSLLSTPERQPDGLYNRVVYP